MKMLFKKAICLLSSAVLLCGASAIPASAAPEQVSISGTSSAFPHLTPLKNTLQNFYLSSGDFELADGETKNIWVKRSSSYDMPLNSTATYQWYKNGTAINGATSYQYTVSSAGKYFCTVTVKTPHTVTNQRTGKKATLYTTKDYDTNLITVCEALAIQSQTGDGTIDIINGWYDLMVKVKGGTEPYTYQWTWNGNSYAGNQPVAGALYAGTYKCRITDSNGKWVETKPIKVSTVPLKITSQPKGGTVLNAKQPIKLSVAVTGGKAPYTYEWTWLNMGTVGGNSSTYDALFAGSYRCKITDSNGNSVISDWAGINVSLLQITDQSPEYVYLSSANGTADIFVTAKGGKTPYTYKWTCNGKDINKNTSSITVSETGEYNCIVTDAYGEVVKSSSKATINVMKPFEFTNYTKGVSSWSYYNNEYTLKVNVTGGTGRYVYNWQKKVGNNWYDVGCYNSEYTINRDDIKDNTYSTTSVKYGQVNWYDESNKKWIVTTNNYSYNTYRCVVKTVGNHGNGNVVSTITTDDIEADKYLGSTTSYHDYWYF